jgi:2-keto-3-deoxy-L-rhamnonate aldolase RhmA
MKTLLKSKLEAGQATVGAWVGIGHPEVAEIMAQVGFDWLVFDTEHAPLSIETVQQLIQAMQGSDTAPLVRVAWNDPVLIKLALDIGSHGLIIPWVNNRDEALQAVRSCRYPPQGIRGVGPRRAARYGLEFGDYLARANEEILTAVQIETRAAVENIDEILDVNGIDVFFIGPADLSASLGYLGQWDAPPALEAIDRLLEAGKRHGVPAGIFAMGLDHAQACLDRGFQFVALGTAAGLLIQGATSALERVGRG